MVSLLFCVLQYGITVHQPLRRVMFYGLNTSEALARIERQTSHIADLREGCCEESVRAKRTERILGEIEGKARWYADNLQRDPQEVDHALCVEILDLAQRALDA